MNSRRITSTTIGTSSPPPAVCKNVNKTRLMLDPQRRGHIRLICIAIICSLKPQGFISENLYRGISFRNLDMRICLWYSSSTSQCLVSCWSNYDHIHILLVHDAKTVNILEGQFALFPGVLSTCDPWATTVITAECRWALNRTYVPYVYIYWHFDSFPHLWTWWGLGKIH